MLVGRRAGRAPACGTCQEGPPHSHSRKATKDLGSGSGSVEIAAGYPQMAFTAPSAGLHSAR